MALQITEQIETVRGIVRFKLAIKADIKKLQVLITQADFVANGVHCTMKQEYLL